MRWSSVCRSDGTIEVMRSRNSALLIFSVMAIFLSGSSDVYIIAVLRLYLLAAVSSAQRIAGIDPHELIPVIQKAQQNICIFAARTAQHLRDPVANFGISITREPFYTELSIFVPSRSFRKSIFLSVAVCMV